VTAAPDLPFHRATTGTVRAESVALKVGGAIGAVVLGLVVLVFVLGEAGPIGLAIGLFAAVLPAPLYLALGLRIDRYEPEPVGMLLGAFAWGATAAVVIALVLNTAAGLIVGSSYGEQTGELFAGNVSAPIVEETAKALVLLAIYRWRRNELNGVLDGLVYAAMVGLGFATTENVLYYARAAVEGQVTLVFVLRGVLSPFAHPVFTAMTGIGIALAVQARQPEVRVIAVVGGLLGAIALHSLWNTPRPGSSAGSASCSPTCSCSYRSSSRSWSRWATPGGVSCRQWAGSCATRCGRGCCRRASWPRCPRLRCAAMRFAGRGRWGRRGCASAST
jgi:RsiW-degrading membrane proteinase PrsW (M82 family)